MMIITNTLLFITFLNIQLVFTNNTSISSGILYWIPYDNEGLLSIYVQAKILLTYSSNYEMQLNIVPYHSRFFNATINLCNIFDFNTIQQPSFNKNNRNTSNIITCGTLPIDERYQCQDTLPSKLYPSKL